MGNNFCTVTELIPDGDFAPNIDIIPEAEIPDPDLGFPVSWICAVIGAFESTGLSFTAALVILILLCVCCSLISSSSSVGSCVVVATSGS